MTVMVNGREELIFRSLESMEIDFSITTEEFNYVGAARAETSEMNGSARLTFRVHPDTPGFGRLMELRRRRATPIAERDDSIRFDITTAMDFGDGGRDRWRFHDVKLSDGNQSVAGRTARVAAALTAICDNPSRMA